MLDCSYIQIQIVGHCAANLRSPSRHMAADRNLADRQGPGLRALLRDVHTQHALLQLRVDGISVDIWGGRVDGISIDHWEGRENNRDRQGITVLMVIYPHQGVTAAYPWEV